jgi:hypothetical protein
MNPPLINSVLVRPMLVECLPMPGRTKRRQADGSGLCA